MFSWGEDSVEKHIEVPTTARPEDEEQRVGTPPATETTPLLTTVVVPARTPFFARLFTRSYSRSAPVVLAPARPQFRPSSSECAICLCDFEKGEMVMQLPCGHLFHRQEIEGWLLDSKRHVSCNFLRPYCPRSFGLTLTRLFSPTPRSAQSAAPPSPSTTLLLLILIIPFPLPLLRPKYRLLLTPPPLRRPPRSLRTSLAMDWPLPPPHLPWRVLQV